MAENTKTPPSQDPRQRNPQGDPSKPEKPGGPAPTSSNPNKPEIDPDRGPDRGPDRDPDRDRQNRGKPMNPGKDGVVDLDDLDDDESSTQRMDRE